MFNDFKSHLGTSMQRLLGRGGEGGANPRPSGTKGAPKIREERRSRSRNMKRDLYTLLEQHPTSRSVMRYLDLVERTLRRGGIEALEALPIRVIAKALNEMERLVWDWSPMGLAELRSRMAVMVKTRPPEAERSAPSTHTLVLAAGHASELGDLAEVTEVDHSAYEETERSWAGQMPEGLADAAEQAKTLKAA
jgi:hypothetical protein